MGVERFVFSLVMARRQFDGLVEEARAHGAGEKTIDAMFTKMGDGTRDLLAYTLFEGHATGKLPHAADAPAPVAAKPAEAPALPDSPPPAKRRTALLGVEGVFWHVDAKGQLIFEVYQRIDGKKKFKTTGPDLGDAIKFRDGQLEEAVS